MYITGDFSDFENRLHALPESGADITNFKIEGSGYLSDWTTSQKYKNERELKKQIGVITRVPDNGDYF